MTNCVYSEPEILVSLLSALCFSAKKKKKEHENIQGIDAQHIHTNNWSLLIHLQNCTYFSYTPKITFNFSFASVKMHFPAIEVINKEDETLKTKCICSLADFSRFLNSFICDDSRKSIQTARFRCATVCNTMLLRDVCLHTAVWTKANLVNVLSLHESPEF